MEKWIKAGHLPPMPATVFQNQNEITNMNQLLNEVENFLLTKFREQIDPELTEEENLEELTAIAKEMLSLLREQGLIQEARPRAIALEAMGKTREMPISEILEEEMLRERINSLIWIEGDSPFPIKLETEADWSPEDPISWAQAIAG